MEQRKPRNKHDVREAISNYMNRKEPLSPPVKHNMVFLDLPEMMLEELEHEARLQNVPLKMLIRKLLEEELNP